MIADTRRPLAVYESGYAPHWYVHRQDVVGSALQPTDGQTFCPYRGIASYYSVGERHAPPGRTSMPGRRRTGVDGGIARGLRSDEILYAAGLSK